MKRSRAARLVLFLVIGFSLQAPARQRIILRLEHFVGDKKLVLDTAVYKNALGQAYTVSRLKYYLGHIELIRADGSSYRYPDYFLVDEEEPASKEIILDSVEEGNYVQMHFILGVDSMHNISGAQSGALDPANGMFWAWNTGYVFFKMEGHSPASTAPGHMLEYHIGGYRSPYDLISFIKLDLGKSGVTISGNEKTVLSIGLNLTVLFDSPDIIDFSKTPSVSDPKAAFPMARNLLSLFYLMHENGRQ